MRGEFLVLLRKCAKTCGGVYLPGGACARARAKNLTLRQGTARAWPYSARGPRDHARTFRRVRNAFPDANGNLIAFHKTSFEH